MSYRSDHWAAHPVIRRGLRLVFDVEPCLGTGADYLTVETFAAALREIENQVEALAEGERTEIQLRARWVTEAAWRQEQESWEDE
jgi:hypothetical protein